VNGAGFRLGRHLASGLLGLALLLDLWATASLAAAMGTANDLFPRWYGTRAWLLSGADPYGAAVTEGIRQAMGGAPGESLGAFVFGFVYPAYVALLLAPLAVLPFPVAATLWLLLAQLAMGAGAWLCWRASEREAGCPRAGTIPALLVTLFLPASLFNLIFGQFAALVFACLAGSWYLLLQRRPGWAGVLLSLAMVKPSVALLPVAALLLWCTRHRQWRTVATWLAGSSALVLASLAVFPGWPVAFWHSTAEYARVASATSAAGLVAGVLSRPTGSSAGTGLAPQALLTGITAALAAAAVGVGWWRSGRRAGDALAAGTLLGAWLVPPLYEWNSVLLLVPLLSWLRRRGQGGSRPPWPAAAALVAGALLSIPLIARWPSESRALWPALALVLWSWPGRPRPAPVDPAPAPAEGREWLRGRHEEGHASRRDVAVVAGHHVALHQHPLHRGQVADAEVDRYQR
jgi:hypothetical protein